MIAVPTAEFSILKASEGISAVFALFDQQFLRIVNVGPVKPKTTLMIRMHQGEAEKDLVEQMDLVTIDKRIPPSFVHFKHRIEEIIGTYF